MRSALSILSLAGLAAAGEVLYNGLIPLKYTEALLNANSPPYTTVVKGSENASAYDTLLGPLFPTTPLWLPKREQAVRISITNTSVFVPGNNVANTQYGFRRTELIAQSPNRTALEVGTTVFHVSILEDPTRRLNLTHEYQIVWIEPDDGSHVFEIQLGTPFTVPSATRPCPQASYLKVRDHALNLLFETPFLPATWHNFAIQVDWTKRTLAVLFSHDALPLRPVTRGVVSNNSTLSGPDGQGDYHWGVLKLPLADPKDTAANQGDVVHHGIQEGTTEALIYSGVFVENVKGGISVGYGATIPHIA